MIQRTAPSSNGAMRRYAIAFPSDARLRLSRRAFPNVTHSFRANDFL